MKCWTILALLITVSAVFINVGQTETTEFDDFEEQSLSDTEHDVQTNADSFLNPENHDENDESENDRNSANAIPSNDEDETKMFKRRPGLRIRIRGRRIKDRVRRIAKGLKKVCKKVEPVLPGGKIKTICKWVSKLGDEEFPVKNDETFIPAENANEQESWLKEEQRG